MSKTQEIRTTIMYCGPYALACLYRAHNEYYDSLRIAAEIKMVKDGTSPTELGIHALSMGYAVTIMTGARFVPARISQEQLRRLVERKTNRSGFWEGERMLPYLKQGGKRHFGAKFTKRALCAWLKNGPLIVSVAAQEYAQIVSWKKRFQRTRSPCYHYLFVRSHTGAGHFVCDDGYASWKTLLIPDDMMLRMLVAHHNKGNVLVIRKTR